MDYTIRLMKPEEYNFAYTQKQEIMDESACIGHLRVDLGSNGQGFYSSWDDHSPELKSQEFKEEFDDVINCLREQEISGCFLKDRDSLKKFCNQFPEAKMTDDGREFGFRLDTDDYTYMMRLNPNRGEYAAYIYAYERDQLDFYLEPIKEPTGVLKDKAVEVKDAAVAAKDEIADKITELDRMLKGVVTEYNDAYTIMNDKGVQLFVERSRAVDSISFVESLVNSIANRPKSFDAEFEEVHTNRKKFTDSCEFAQRELKEARKAAVGAGAGLAAGASVAFIGPTAAMWVATTFGTASTGTAISALSGAAAQSAALAWLGGGSLAAGGGGMLAGKAFIAMTGPIGWTIAGATLLSSIVLFTTQKTKLNKQKNEEIQAIKQNIELVQEMDGKISLILDETISIRNGLNDMLKKALPMYGADYLSIADDQKQLLGALINNTKALAALFGKTIGEADETES